MTTSDNSVIISAGKRIYTLDMNTYQATLLATSPYVNEINSIASDNITGWIFYVSNHISRYNWTIYGYNVYTNTHKNFGSVRHFFTPTGHAYSSRGLASGGATFYNGKLYFAMEYPTYCYYYRGENSGNANPKDELSNNMRSTGTVSNSLFTNGPVTRNTSTEADDADDGGGRAGAGETPAGFEIIDDEEANALNDLVSDYIPEEELPVNAAADSLLQRGNTNAESGGYNYYSSRYNNKMYLLEISFSGLSDASGGTTSVSNGAPVYDNWGYSSFRYRGELGDIVVDDNGQLYAATSYQVQAYNFNSNRYDWANNEDVYAQMAKDKNSALQLLKNKRQCSTSYYYGCPHTTCTKKSFVQSYTAPSSLRTYNNIHLGSLNEITGLNSSDVGRITDASDYVRLTPPVSYKIQGYVFDDNNEDGNFDSGSGETKLDGVTVTLHADNNADGVLDAGDTVIETKNTNATGNYTFNDVQVGSTLVQVTVPNNNSSFTYNLTTAEIISVTGTTSDVTGIKFGINKEEVINVAYDVFGTVYDDDNENAALETGEAGLDNVTLTLYNDTNADGVLDAGDTVITTTTSGTDGSYSFLHVCIQHTIVAVTVPTNTGSFTYTLTTPGTQAIDSINTNVTGVDFGVNELQVVDYNISGNIYDDNDESGAQDAGEDDLESITVTLYADNNANGVVDAGDAVITSAASAVDGTYNFLNVTVENTVVQVTVPANTGNFTYVLTTLGEQNTSSTTTDVIEVNFGINEVQIIDFNISGVVFDDDNENGVQDAGEGVLDGINIILYADNNADGNLDVADTTLTSTSTGVNGAYSFSNITTPNVLAVITTPGNTATLTYVLTTSNTQAASSTTVDITGLDFGINEEEVINYDISGNVFDDNDGDGLISAGEGFIGATLITLYADTNNDGVLDAGDTVITTTTTNTMSGNYNFTGVTVQNTIVAVTVPTNTGSFSYALTTAGDQAVSSTMTNVTGVNFGIDRVQVINYNISGTVFDDDNENGTIDTAEAGRLDNVTLTLYADNDNNGRVGTGDVIITTTTSATDGTFGFSAVTTQNTLVEVSVPANNSTYNYTLTTSEMKVTSSITSDVIDVDFGINQTTASYAISGNVFNDANGDGNNASDGGLTGVTVRLYADTNQNGRIDRNEPLLTTTVSDRNGNYNFSGLTDIYVVVQVLVPANTAQFQYVTTTPVSVGLSSGVNTTVNFGITRTLVILYNVSGVVWDDNNADQIIDANELRLEGIGMTLYDDVNGNGVIDVTDTALSTITTSVTGTYQFTNINLRNVIIAPTLPSNGTYTTQGTRAISSINTDVVNVDFGIDIAANLFQVTGVVFDDDNQNGIADVGEGSIDGLSVEIYVDTDSSGTFDPNLDALVAFTQTSNGGFGFLDPNYLVNAVPPGLVFVVIGIPASTQFISYTPTFDPDTGTVAPDGVFPTIMTGNIANVNFGINFVDLNATSRYTNGNDVLFTNGNTVAAAPQDVSERLRLYPNPTARQFTINSEEFDGDVTVEIYNDRGYKVMTRTVSSIGNEFNIDVERLAPGMYYAKFASKNKVASKKFIKR
jgi:hypothetical protein